jgi:hypothetical protein
MVEVGLTVLVDVEGCKRTSHNGGWKCQTPYSSHGLRPIRLGKEKPAATSATSHRRQGTILSKIPDRDCCHSLGDRRQIKVLLDQTRRLQAVRASTIALA